MQSLTIAPVKDFMQHLLRLDTFDAFELRGIKIFSFTCFEISGDCAWENVKPYAFDIVKGKEKPRSLKIVLAHAQPETLHANAAALFINLQYESEAEHIACTTGSSQKQFELDKQMDAMWDAWVLQFLRQKGLTVTISGD